MYDESGLSPLVESANSRDFLRTFCNAWLPHSMWDAEDIDHRLVQRFLQGDQASFQALFEKHKDRIYSIAFRIVRNAEEAQDILQETFLSVFREAYKFQFKSRFSTWLASIAIHASINRAKRARLHPIVPIGEQAAPAPKENEAQGQLAQAFLKLSPVLRAVLVLRYFQGMEYPEIAQVLDCPIGTVKSRLNHAHAKLREVLNHEMQRRP